MKPLSRFALGLTAVSLIVSLGLLGSLRQHERLRLQNTFKTPEDVVRYYCARDASGFVWSGLLEKERKEFTLWDEAPETESFMVADTYEIVQAGGRKLASQDTVQIEVRYQIRGLSDAYGTMIPARQRDYRVTFVLKRINGQWKIAEPRPPQISPVVLASKFTLNHP